MLCCDGDFPVNTEPWRLLSHSGASVRLIGSGSPPTADEVRGSITKRTKVLCGSYVDSFTGRANDVDGIGDACRERGVLYALNCSQAAGARVLDVEHRSCDFVFACGYKWLCGPYGTGFCWMRRGIAENMIQRQVHWWRERRRVPKAASDFPESAADVFGTGNFFNFIPWCRSLECLLGVGLSSVYSHNDAICRRFVECLDQKAFTRLSGGAGESAIVLISHRDRSRNAEIQQWLKEHGVDVAIRRGNLRVSMHIHNSIEDIERCAELLNRWV